MNALKTQLLRLIKDETGGEILEYALIMGLILIGAIAVIGAVGVKVLARWNDIDSYSM